jgi:uncharacterized protein
MSIHSSARFEWDAEKARLNRAIHGVRFADAATVFDDERAVTREDPDSIGERRYVTLGMSAEGRLLVVVYAWRGPDTIRIISAWTASARQRNVYAQGSG